MHGHDNGSPTMFGALHQWALILRDLGDLTSAQSAAESLCRQGGTHAEQVEAGRLLAELAQATGDVASTRAALEHLVALARSAAATDPSSARRFELLAALDHLGDLARRQGDHWGVVEAHGDLGRMGVLRELVAAHGEAPSLLTEQCYSLRRAGNAARQMGAHNQAQALLDERLTVARKTCAGAPTDRRLVGLVAAALHDLGSLMASLGDQRAATLLQEELLIRQWLQAGRPHDPEARQELARTHVAMMSVGPDTAEHARIATTLLTQIEAEGSLDVTGRMMLSSLRDR